MADKRYSSHQSSIASTLKGLLGHSQTIQVLCCREFSVIVELIRTQVSQLDGV